MLSIRSDLRVLATVGLAVLLILMSLLAAGCWDESNKTGSAANRSVGSAPGVAGRGLESGMGSPPIAAPAEPEPKTGVPAGEGPAKDAVSPEPSGSGTEGPSATPALPTTATTPSEPTTSL